MNNYTYDTPILKVKKKNNNKKYPVNEVFDFFSYKIMCINN